MASAASSGFLGKYFSRPKDESEDPNARKVYDASKQAEFDKQPLWERMMTDIPMGIADSLMGTNPGQGSLLGRNGPREFANAATQAIGLAAPMLGMTKYLKDGVPDVAARLAGTQQFRDKMRGISTTADIGGQQFANRYPRIAAHMDPEVMPEGLQNKYRGLAQTNKPFVDDPTKVNIKIAPYQSPGEAASTIAHEGTHVAQVMGLGPSDFNKLYAGANNTPSIGYKNNPLENSARATGARAKITNESGKVPKYKDKPINVMREFENVVRGLPAGDSDRISLGSVVARRRK